MSVSNSRVSSALVWSAVDVLGRFGLNFVVVIILARILSPEDFGLVAMLALFVSLAGVLIDSGFSQALIQRQNTTLIDESTIFFFTLGMGLLFALVLCLSAPLIASFYEQPILQTMTYWLALNLLLNTFSTIHTTLLTKELDFKTIAKTGFVSSLISSGIAIFMAYDGYGVWSLIGKALATTVTTVILLWFLHSWRPQWRFSYSSLRSLFGFGGYLLWSGILNAIYINLYALLIGKIHSVQEVGYYSQAQRLQKLPVTILGSMVGQVAFSAFSATSENKVKLTNGMRKAIISMMFINAPLMLGLMFVAEPLVLTLLGNKWLPSVPVLQILTIGGVLMPLNLINISVLKAQGHSALNARIQAIKLTIAVVILLITSPYGILAMAYGQVVSGMISFIINTHYSKIHLNYGWKAQLRDVFPYMIISILLFIFGWMFIKSFDFPQYYRFLLIVLIAGGYLLLCHASKLKAIGYVREIVSRK